MRLWPYQMLDVLPYRQMLSQWRECLAISGMIRNGDGKVNHATINRLNDYPIEHFCIYCKLVIKEFKRREWTIGTNAIGKLNENIDYESIECDYKEKIEKDENGNEIKTVYVLTPDGKSEKLFENFHNERYIKQCLYSFQEKYDVNMLNDKEWKILENKFKYLLF